VRLFLAVNGCTVKNQRIVVLAIPTVLAHIAAAAIETKVRADGAEWYHGFRIKHDIIKLRVTVVPKHHVLKITVALIYTELFFVYVFKEVEAEVEDFLALRESIVKVVSE
jgi:hypothetical protein